MFHRLRGLEGIAQQQEELGQRVRSVGRDLDGGRLKPRYQPSPRISLRMEQHMAAATRPDALDGVAAFAEGQIGAENTGSAWA
ncbi:hypothetical protein [Falsiroseomonas sp. E2-1-a20]|uniref:hypothetical protein n=1 Tax=Falsiroseomonas sp. E2-1-a20 TaxID=3239300 RepID=UPI003F2E92F8